MVMWDSRVQDDKGTQDICIHEDSRSGGTASFMIGCPWDNLNALGCLKVPWRGLQKLLESSLLVRRILFFKLFNLQDCFKHT